MKPDARLSLTIGRLGARAAIEPKTLRYYDRVGLVRPAARTAAGYRLYGEDAVNRLRFIRRAKALRMSLADIRRIFAVRDDGAAPCRHVLALVERNLAAVGEQLTELERLRADLCRFHRLLREKVPPEGAKADDCPCFALIQQFEMTPGRGSRSTAVIKAQGRGRRRRGRNSAPAPMAIAGRRHTR
jgi:DNA-binding transcriptional MerR regulator